MSSAGLAEPVNVALAASPAAAGDSAVAPRTNQALQLAGALADVEPAARDFAQAYSQQAQQQASEGAKKEAIKNNGMALADAVRTGKIDATANPWFMQAYEQESAKVSAQNAVDTLRAQSTAWPEQNDPGAFATRWNKELGGIAQIYTSPNQITGFNAVAGPSTQQALAVNTEINVQRITQERAQNISSLVAKTVMDTNAQMGGRVSPAQLIKNLEPLKQEWLSTGGTVPAWNKMIVDGTISAAYNTHNTNILDVTKGIPNGGGGFLYDEEGAARGVESAKLEILRDARMQRSEDMQATQFQQYQNDRAEVANLFKVFGPKIYTGLSSQEVGQYVSSTGADPNAVASALGVAAKSTNDVRELQANRWANYSSSPEGTAHLGNLYQEAQTQGFNPDFQKEVGAMALRGDISTSTQNTLIDIANKTARRNATTPGASPNTIIRHQAQNIQEWTDVRESAIKAISVNQMAFKQHTGQDLPGDKQVELQDTAIKAADGWLETHAPVGGKPDFVGAKAAAGEAVKNWWRSYLTSTTTPPTPSAIPNEPPQSVKGAFNGSRGKDGSGGPVGLGWHPPAQDDPNSIAGQQ